MRMILLLLISWQILSQNIYAQASNAIAWSADTRSTYIYNSLQALQSSDANTRLKAQEHVAFIARTNCRSSVMEFKVQCMMDSVNKYCSRLGRSKKESCLSIYDILIVNNLSELDFLSYRDRYRILQKNRGRYGQAAIGTEILKKHAELAASFSMSKHLGCYQQNDSCFSESIDRFCVNQSHKGHLTWQTCVGVLVWFIAQS